MSKTINKEELLAIFEFTHKITEIFKLLILRKFASSRMDFGEFIK